MTTAVEYLPPRARPGADWTESVRAFLDRQAPIVAAYLVSARYPATDDHPSAEQDELHLELRNRPRGGPSPAFFVGVATEMPSGIGVTFERLLKGSRDHRRGRLVTTRVRLAVDVDFASSDVDAALETFRRVTEDASDILVRETGHAGSSLVDPAIRRDDLLVFDRRERR